MGKLLASWITHNR